MKTALSCRGPGLNALCLRCCYYYPCAIGEGTEVDGELAVHQSRDRDSHNLWPQPLCVSSAAPRACPWVSCRVTLAVSPLWFVGRPCLWHPH